MRASLFSNRFAMALGAMAALMLWAAAALADAERFAGRFAGSADLVQEDGTVKKRDLSVEIEETRKGSAWNGPRPHTAQTEA